MVGSGEGCGDIGDYVGRKGFCFGCLGWSDGGLRGSGGGYKGKRL